MSKLPMWQQDWDRAEREWDQQAKLASKKLPLKELKSLPHMVGITPETKKNLKWKSLKWMVQKDHSRKILKGFLKHPIKYGLALLKSSLKKKSYSRKGDFFLYGITSTNEFENELVDPNSLLILGFSYCHKPFECPSGRFTPDCKNELTSPICQQCFIGKALQASKHEKTIPLLIPTIHYIGEKIFEIVHANPDKKILFIISACELTLEMFGDWGNMVDIKGIGVRLDGRICNTMKAFELSEQGIKPGLTVILEDTKVSVLKLIRIRNQAFSGSFN